MDSTQKNSTSLKFILQYKPAQLTKWANGEWRIVFYSLDVDVNKMKRHTGRVPPMKPARLREGYADKMVNEINSQLEKGWRPGMEENASEAFNSLISVFGVFVKRLEKSVADGEKRKATLTSYESYIRVFKRWMVKTRRNEILAIQLTKDVLVEFLDWIYYDQKNSASTHNNYLTFFSAFAGYLLQRKIVSKNPTLEIPRKKTNPKSRKSIPEKVRERIFEHIAATRPPYLLVCKLMYYQLLGRTEMSKLKISDIQFENGVILIRPEVSNPWETIKKELDLPNEYQFYSLKDSGITDLLNAGVPAKVVRDHARHHDIAVTQKYTDKGNAANKELLTFRRSG